MGFPMACGYSKVIMDKYDIAIVGGGPAGSTAALYLYDLGFNVCLIEKKNFPREILCGEFLSREVIDTLKNLNFFDGFLKLNPNPITKFKLYNDNNSFFEAKLKFSAYGIKRGIFDNFLLDVVKKKGVAVLQPVEVKEIIHSKEFITLVVNNDQSSQTIVCNKVIAAYGKQNILDKKLNRNFVTKKSFLNGVKFHVDESLFNVLEKDAIQIFAAKGIYCGINSVDENIATVCFLENRQMTQNNPRDQIKTLMDGNKNFELIFANGFINSVNDLPVYGTGNIFLGKRELVKNGIYFIGDSSAVIAPLAGDGIGMAMQSAKLISKTFDKQRSDELDDFQTELFYKREWGRLFRKRILIAKLIQNIIMNNYFRRIGYSIIKTFPGLLESIITATRG